MKNKELKEAFAVKINCRKSSINTVNAMMKNIGKVEDKLNKEFACWNLTDLKNYLQSKESGSAGTIDGRIWYIRQYAEFYGEQTGDINNHLASLTIAQVHEMIADKLHDEASEAISRDRILSVADELINARDKAILLGVYEGIMGKNFQEFLEIRPEDVKDDRIFIQSRNKDLKVSKELIKYFREAMKVDVYYRGDIRDVQEPMVCDDKIAIKMPVRNLNHMHRSFRAILKRIGEKYEIKDLENAGSLRRWGEANYIAEKILLEEIPVEQAYLKYRKEVMDRFDIQTMRRDSLLARVLSILREAEEDEDEK